MFAILETRFILFGSSHWRSYLARSLIDQLCMYVAFLRLKNRCSLKLYAASFSSDSQRQNDHLKNTWFILNYWYRQFFYEKKNRHMYVIYSKMAVSYDLYIYRCFYRNRDGCPLNSLVCFLQSLFSQNCEILWSVIE